MDKVTESRAKQFLRLKPEHRELLIKKLALDVPRRTDETNQQRALLILKAMKHEDKLDIFSDLVSR